MIRTAPLALALSLIVCAAEPQTADEVPSPAGAPTMATAQAKPAAPATASAQTTPALALEAGGLRLFNRESGSARPIPFGTDWEQVRRTLAFRGPPGTGTNGECGAGPLDYASWPDGLTLYAQSGKFVGWAADGRGEGALFTAASIGPGSTRTQLLGVHTATFSETTLGTEFASGDLYGLLDGPGADAKITNMWSGVSCNFR